MHPFRDEKDGKSFVFDYAGLRSFFDRARVVKRGNIDIATHLFDIFHSEFTHFSVNETVIRLGNFVVGSFTTSP